MSGLLLLCYRKGGRTMKKRNFVCALLTFVLCSCQDPVASSLSEQSSSEAEQSRVYEAFGSYSAEQVEEICRTAAERKGPTYDPDCFFIQYDLGTFGAKHFNILKYEKKGKTEIKTARSISYCGYYLCDVPSFSYELNIWVEGLGSFDFETLFFDGAITDEEAKSVIAEANRLGIRKGGAFNTSFEDFTFSFKWDYGQVNGYDSGTKLITKLGKTNSYTGSYEYPNIRDVYEKVQNMDIYSYPDEFYPYRTTPGPDISSHHFSERIYYYVLTIGDKTIIGNESTTNIYWENLEERTPQGRKFLELVYTLRETIEGSDEYNSVVVPEDDVITTFH